jgi:hypothetical protein
MDSPIYDRCDAPERDSALRLDDQALLPAAAYLRHAGRVDGWSAGRQAAFLLHLADHGLVADAARCVGMSLSSAYALRRHARGYGFALGWEAALLVARRIVADNLLAAAIRGEEARWIRADGETRYTRQNVKLSLALLDRADPATALPEVLAITVRFDWFVRLIDDAVPPQDFWQLFFDAALPHREREARDRVRACLLLSEESATFADADAAEEEEEE